MNVKKTIQGTAATGMIGVSFLAGGQFNEQKIEELASKNKTEIKEVMNWSEDQVNVFEQQQAVIRRQRAILDQWDSCELCKEKCSVDKK